MLFTPPYCPDFQPIKLFWGAAKNYVARTFGRSRTTQAVVTSLRRGWHGGAVIGKEVVKEAVGCEGLVEHNISCLNEAIEGDDVLSGSIEGGLESVPKSYKVSKESGLDALKTYDKVELLDVDAVDEDDDESDGLSDLQDGSPGLDLEHPETCDGVESDEEGDIVMDESGS